MAILEIVRLALQFAMALWTSLKKTPEEIKLDAIAKITKEMTDDIKSFDQALAANDAAALTSHFQLLTDRVRTHTAAAGGNPGLPPNQGN